MTRTLARERWAQGSMRSPSSRWTVMFLGCWLFSA